MGFGFRGNLKPVYVFLKKKKKGNSTFDLFKWDFEGVRTGSENRAKKGAPNSRSGGWGRGVLLAKKIF